MGVRTYVCTYVHTCMHIRHVILSRPSPPALNAEEDYFSLPACLASGTKNNTLLYEQGPTAPPGFQVSSWDLTEKKDSNFLKIIRYLRWQKHVAVKKILNLVSFYWMSFVVLVSAQLNIWFLRWRPDNHVSCRGQKLIAGSGVYMDCLIVFQLRFSLW